MAAPAASPSCRFERRHHGLVFGKCQFQPAPCVEKPPHAVKAQPRRLRGIAHPLIAQLVLQCGMEGEVEAVEALEVLRLDGGLLVAQVAAQLVEQRAGAAAWAIVRTVSTSSARRKNMFSRASEILISATREPLCGMMSTSPSDARRFIASPTGKRETPIRAAIACLSRNSPGFRSSCTMASRSAACTRAVAPPGAAPRPGLKNS